MMAVTASSHLRFKHLFTLLWCVIFHAPTTPAVAQTAAASHQAAEVAAPVPTYVWKPLKTGAGGYITGINLNAPSAVAYARTDVGGAYRLYLKKNQRWKQIITASSMPAAKIKNNVYGGVLSIASAPSNGRRVYAMWLNTIFRSDNAGDKWRATALTLLPEPDQGGEDPNADPGKFEGERLAVDPANPDIVYYGSLRKGLFVTINGGSDWKSVPQVPLAGLNDNGVGNVRFDPSYGVLAGKTLVIYASIDGKGIYRTGNAGQNWQKITRASSDPVDANIPPDSAEFRHIEVGMLHDFYAISNGSLFRYVEGVWKDLKAPVCYQGQCDADAIAIDPFKYGHFLLFRSNGNSFESFDRGGTFSPLKFVDRVGGDVPWLSFTDEDFFTHSNAYFDPLTPNKIWIGNGIGAWTSSDYQANTVHWTSLNNGIEELVNNVVVSPPGGKVVTGHWDRAIFYHEELDKFPLRHSPTRRFNSAWDITYAANIPTFLVATVHDHRGCCSQYVGPDDQSGYSTDGGKNWTVFPSVLNGTAPADLKFGDIAVASSDTNNIVWLPWANKPPYYTTDRGASWNRITFLRADGSDAFQGSYPDFNISRHVVAADTVSDRTFYIYSSPERIIYKSTNGGINWQQVGTSANGLDHDHLNLAATLKAVPRHAGHLCMSGGYRGDLIPALACSTDGGAHWTPLLNTAEVTSFGFGKSATAGSYPTIFIQGVVNGKPGVWCTASRGARWGRLATYPLGIPSAAFAMDGDKEVFGRVYMGFGGNGFTYGQSTAPATADLCGG